MTVIMQTVKEQKTFTSFFNFVYNQKSIKGYFYLNGFLTDHLHTYCNIKAFMFLLCTLNVEYIDVRYYRWRGNGVVNVDKGHNKYFKVIVYCALFIY